MITGLYVGMENSSFNTAIQCLSVAIQDKVTFCQSYGLQIQPEDWPIYGLPGAILADRGELIGYQIELLEKNFSVRIENAPAVSKRCQRYCGEGFRNHSVTL